MKETVISNTTGKEYYPSDCVRIVNAIQAATYAIHGATLYDVYPSRDFKTNKPIWVFIFNREESRQLYDKWCKYELE